MTSTMDVKMSPANGVAAHINVRTEALLPGMVPAEDVRHFNGRLILRAGTALEEKDIRIIKMWGIPGAFIQQGEGVTTGNCKEDPEQMERLRPVIDDHFRFADLDHPVTRELYQLSLECHAAEGSPLPPQSGSGKIPGDWATQRENHLFVPFDDTDEILETVELPSLPEIVVRINEAVNNPNCTATHVGNIISKDASLTARLLKIANSPLYNFPSKINSIPHAVAIIGSRQLSLLAVSSVIASTFSNIPAHVIDMEAFWKHSVACGIVARLLAGYKSNTNTENYFLAGLLHDVGRLIIYRYFPEYGIEVMARARKEGKPMLAVERGVLGLDHGEIGGMLISKWHLSSAFECACRFHHSPLESSEPLITSIIHLADIIAAAMYMGNSGDGFVPRLEPGAWKTIGLPVEVLKPITTQAAKLLDDTVTFYKN